MKKFIETVIFGSKWILIPFYIALVFALIIYMSVLMQSVGEFAVKAFHRELDEDGSMLMLLKSLDITMIANLVKMIITGSYTSFVNKSHDHPEKISSGTLKVKMGMSLVGVSSINMLQVFVNADHINMDIIIKKSILHGLFLIGSLVLAFVDHIHVKSESIAAKTEHDYPEEGETKEKKLLTENNHS